MNDNHSASLILCLINEHCTLLGFAGKEDWVVMLQSIIKEEFSQQIKRNPISMRHAQVSTEDLEYSTPRTLDDSGRPHHPKHLLAKLQVEWSLLLISVLVGDTEGTKLHLLICSDSEKKYFLYLN